MDIPLEFVSEVARTRGWMETANKENARHFVSFFSSFSPGSLTWRMWLRAKNTVCENGGA